MAVDKRPVITICCSASFYRQALEIQEQLEKMGFQTIVPSTAHRMKKSGNFEVSHYKTWYGKKEHHHKKTELMAGHFREVEKADAILVTNYEKHGQPNYIGGNVLMEMTLAFYLGKPIMILNEIPEKSPLWEEIIGLQPIVLHGKLEKLPAELKKALAEVRQVR